MHRPPYRITWTLAALGLLLGASGTTPTLAAPPDRVQKAAEEAFAPVVDDFNALIKEGRVVGGQLVVGDRDGITLERSFGRRAPDDPTPVDAETMFCIGSCSKPIASACILSLVGDGTLKLDEPIARRLPEFASLKLESGGPAARSPNLRELLAHRGGIYSQKEGMSPRQTSWIRDFSKTLEASVRGIAAEALIAPPGSRYAYSGAGYCVVGRLAEVATKTPFETLLQERVVRPLGMTRTTYFPPGGESNVAVGAGPQGRKDPLARRLLGPENRLPLVGGSLFTTAVQEARFARMILDEGKAGDTTIIPASAWKEVVRRQFPGMAYGLGWGQTFDAQDRVTRLQHTGQLGGYNSYLGIDRVVGCYAVVHWTVSAGPSAQGEPADLANLTPAATEALARFGASLRAIRGGAARSRSRK